MNFGTILVVNGEPWSHCAVRTTLTNLGNYLVVPAKTSEEALALIRRESPDLVIIDLDMLGRVIRERNCLEACRAIRQATDRPIIVISERDTERDRVAALDAGLTISCLNHMEYRSYWRGSAPRCAVCPSGIGVGDHHKRRARNRLCEAAGDPCRSPRTPHAERA